MMTTDALGLYVHIPFCVKKCNYCDFCSFSDLTSKERNLYLKQLVLEIEGYRREPKIEVDTIFFGGGTPSLLDADEFALICKKIREVFSVSKTLEFTIEVNPKTITEQKAKAFCDCGVNRVSIGLQTIHENERKILGRIHNYQDFEKCFCILRSAGVENINVDVMYAIPEQNIDSFKETLLAVTSLSPEHISVYGLILEEGTLFWQMRNDLALPGEDEECKMYYTATEFLSKNGYSHYEISNYAKPGYESKHNLKYWNNQEYIGVGITAYSNFESERYGNTSDFKEYITTDKIRPIFLEKTDINSKRYEYVMLKLRLSSGFLLSEYFAMFGESFLDGRAEKIKNYADMGFLIFDGERIALTERGFYVSNTILADLL